MLDGLRAETYLTMICERWAGGRSLGHWGMLLEIGSSETADYLSSSSA